MKSNNTYGFVTKSKIKEYRLDSFHTNTDIILKESNTTHNTSRFTVIDPYEQAGIAIHLSNFASSKKNQKTDRDFFREKLRENEDLLEIVDGFDKDYSYYTIEMTTPDGFDKYELKELQHGLFEDLYFLGNYLEVPVAYVVASEQSIHLGFLNYSVSQNKDVMTDLNKFKRSFVDFSIASSMIKHGYAAGNLYDYLKDVDLKKDLDIFKARKDMVMDSYNNTFAIIHRIQELDAEALNNRAKLDELQKNIKTQVLDEWWITSNDIREITNNIKSLKDEANALREDYKEQLSITNKILNHPMRGK